MWVKPLILRAATTAAVQRQILMLLDVLMYSH
jgi:hypothetical protein